MRNTALDPADEADRAIASYIRAMRQLDGSRPLASFIETHGRSYFGMETPDKIPMGEPRQCFANSQRYLMAGGFTNLFYVEGLACPSTDGFPIPVLHGWLADANGNVLDLTWKNPEAATYFGVAFKSTYVLERTLATKLWDSMLDSPYDRFALIKGLVRPEDALAYSDAF